MEVRAAARATVNGLFGLAGLEVRRVPMAQREQAPPIFENPLDALHYARAGVSASFWCPIEDTREANGLGFSRRGWHPYVATLEEYALVGQLDYRDSVLSQYFEVWQPGNALEAVPGLPAVAGTALAGLPPHLVRYFPWQPRRAREVDASVRYWLTSGAVEHGMTDFDLERDGYYYHGPVSQRIGELEYQRLLTIFRILGSQGYDRSHGDVEVLIVRRGGALRYLVTGGRHRVGALRALGVGHVPATFSSGQPALVCVDDVDHWPQVRRGSWTRSGALAYVDLLFEFDSAAWAAERGLVREAPTRHRNVDATLGPSTR